MDITINKTVFIIFFLSSSLPEHRHATHFMWPFVFCKFVEFGDQFQQGVEVERWCSACKILLLGKEIMTPFPSKMGCALFLCLALSLHRTFNTTLNRSNKIRHSHILVLGGNLTASHNSAWSIFYIWYPKYKISSKERFCLLFLLIWPW